MGFFSFLKRKNKDSTIENMDVSKEVNPQNMPQTDPIEAMSKNIGSMNVKMKTYDIIVFDVDDAGRQKQTPVNGVKATSPQELVSLYASCDQKIRILKEYDTDPSPPLPKIPSPPPEVQRVLDSPSEKKNLSSRTIEEKIDDIVDKPAKHEAPHFFEVGGIKCKMENGRVYQEQWCKVDASKYRLISDANNKEISMNGKHLETLKWVLIEENNG